MRHSDVSECNLTHRELAECIWDLLEEDWNESSIQLPHAALGCELGKAGRKTRSKFRIRHKPNSSSLKWSQEYVGEKSFSKVVSCGSIDAD